MIVKRIPKVMVYVFLIATLFLPWRDWISPLHMFPFQAKLLGWQSLYVDLVILAKGVLMWDRSAVFDGVIHYGLIWFGDCAPIVAALGLMTMIQPGFKWLKRIYLAAAAVSLVGLAYSAAKPMYTMLLSGYWVSFCLMCVVIAMETALYIAGWRRRRAAA